MFIQTESTPNPNSLKFILEQEIAAERTFEFNSIDDCENSELAAQLLNIDGVESIFFGLNFISVNKDKFEWDQLKAPILTKIADYLSSGKPILKTNDKTNLGNQISSIINSGNLVSDQVVGDLIKKYISNKIYKNRLIFDGYPRNLIQARNLDNLLEQNDQKVNLVLKLSVSLETIKHRISERKTLEKRTDDSESIAIKRYKTYENNIKPVIDFYKQSNLLKVVNGEMPITQISDEISGLIEGIKG